MKLTIKINNKPVEIELTDEQMYEVFCEQRRLFDIEDVKSRFDEIPDEELMYAYGHTYAELEPLFEDMSVQYRRNIQKYDLSPDYALSDAINSVLARKENNNA